MNIIAITTTKSTHVLETAMSRSDLHFHQHPSTLSLSPKHTSVHCKLSDTLLPTPHAKTRSPKKNNEGTSQTPSIRPPQHSSSLTHKSIAPETSRHPLSPPFSHTLTEELLVTFIHHLIPITRSSPAGRRACKSSDTTARLCKPHKSSLIHFLVDIAPRAV